MILRAMTKLRAILVSFFIMAGSIVTAEQIEKCGDATLSLSERNQACDLLLEAGVFDEALLTALNNLALSPSDPSAPSDLHDLNVIISVRLSHNPDGIIAYATTGINHTDNIAELYLLRSNGHRSNGDFTSEVADLERARSISPLSAEYSVRLIEAYLETDQLLDALDQTDTLIKYVAPNGPLEMEMLGRKAELEASGDSDNLAEDFQQFLSKLEQNRRWAVAAKMQILFAMGDYSAALRVSDQLLGTTDDLVHAFWFRGIILRQSDRFEDALTSFDKAFETAELNQQQISAVRYQSLLVLRGEVLVVLGMFEAALKDFEELFKVADVSMVAEVVTRLHERGHLTKGVHDISHDRIVEATISCLQDISCSTSIHQVFETHLTE